MIYSQAAGPYIIGHAHEARMKAQATPLNFSLTTWGQIKELMEGSVLLLCSPKKAAHLAFLVIKSCLGYILVGLAFLAFVHLNNGVVVGDRTAHAVVIHPTQVLYFCAFCLAFSAPYGLSRLWPFWQTCKKHWLLMPLATIVISSIVNTFTLAHPYLLADNRHYTFYIWRRIIVRNEWSAMVLIPVYLYGAFCVLYSLRRTDLAFKLAFPFCVMVNLTPQYLLEFRYFVIPFIIYRLQVRPQSWLHLILELIMFLTVNALTLYLFLFKPFEWPHEPGVIQRFMW
jgi:alpha-1,2-glucosyltransferase